MEVDEEEEETEEWKEEGAEITKKLKAGKIWYTDAAQEIEDIQSIVELISKWPAQLNAVLQSLIHALSFGCKDPAGIEVTISNRRFQDRHTIKVECRRMLAQYKQGEHLNPVDTELLTTLLQFHPRGEQKLNGCRAVTVGKHPAFGILCFFVVRENSQEDFSYIRCVDNAPTREMETQARICDALRAVLQIHPAAHETVASIIALKFPNHVSLLIPVETHRNWTRSMLRLCDTLPILKDYLLVTIIRKLVEIDVDTHKCEEETEQELLDEAALDRLGQVLDAIMLLMFDYFQRNLDKRDECTQAHNELVKTLFAIFDKVVLHTHRLRHVQFLFFYIASLNRLWAEELLILLLTLASSVDEQPYKRQICLAYIASFIARAAFITPSYTVQTLNYVAQFAFEMLPKAECHILQGKLEHPQAKLFLSTVQAVCYMICFKASTLAAEMTGSGKTALEEFLFGKSDTDANRFTRIIQSPCKPITRINDNVAKQFRRSIKQFHPSTAEDLRVSLMEIENRNMVDVVDSKYKSTVVAEAFFPFDPYRLQNSRIFLLGVYQSWPGAGDESESDSEEEDEPPAAPGFNTDANDDTSGSDFTDTAELAVRGFVPSVEPSPAFRKTTTSFCRNPVLMKMLLTSFSIVF